METVLDPDAPLAAARERRRGSLLMQNRQKRRQRAWDEGFARLVQPALAGRAAPSPVVTTEGAPQPVKRRRPKGEPRPKNKGGRPFALSPKQVERAIELACCGWTQKEIALFLKVSEDTIKRRLRVPEVRARIAEFKTKVQGDVELAIREFEDAKELAKHSRKPLTPEQIIEHIGEMALAEAIVDTAPKPQPVPAPKPEVKYLPHYFVPPVAVTPHPDPWAETQRLYPSAAAKVRDWRSLPIPDVWTRRPAPSKPAPLKTHGYGSPTRAAFRG